MIIDASVVFKWFADEAGSDCAVALIDAETLSAPFLMLSEVGNGFRKGIKRGELSADAPFPERLSTIPAIVTLLDESDDVPMALKLAAALDHSIYDCVYLAMAIRMGERLVTADAKFLRKIAATTHAPRVQGL